MGSNLTRNIKFAIVMPVYEDLASFIKLISSLYKEFGRSVFIVAIDDGSVHSPIHSSDIENAGLEGVVIKMRRNVGHQRAIATGLNFVANKLPDTKVVVMDSDGEDRPSSIQALVDKLEVSTNSIVVAKRKNRVESLRFKTFYIFYKSLFKLMTGRLIDFGNFMALSPSAVLRLTAMNELWIHVAACVVSSKLSICRHSVDRGRRYSGNSKMNFVALSLHGFRALMVFAEDVLVRVGMACVTVAFASVFLSILALILKLVGFATPGWFSVALGVLVIIFLQTGALALMTLMITGVMRNNNFLPIQYDNDIDIILHASGERE